jgi:membrane protein DedA with SNARE-associated domain
MLENAGIPVPGEAIVLAAGFFASQGVLALPVVMGVAALGAMLGDNTGYLVGRRLGRPFFVRYGRFMLLSPGRLTVLEAFFARYGPPTVLMARFVSGLPVAAAFCAGMSHMPWRMFFLYNATGAVLWAATVSSLSYLFGQSWVALERWMGRAGLVAMITVAVGLVGVALLCHARHLRYTGLLWLLRHHSKDKGEASCQHRNTNRHRSTASSSYASKPSGG